MSETVTRFTLCCVIALQFSVALSIADDELEPVMSYLEFSDYYGGSISYQQIPEENRAKVLFVDVRSQEEFVAGHIPGAINIEWRTVLDNKQLLPVDRLVILYCNSGVVSSQAMMALRIYGFESVRTLSHGYTGYISGAY